MNYKDFFKTQEYIFSPPHIFSFICHDQTKGLKDWSRYIYYRKDADHKICKPKTEPITQAKYEDC